MTMNGADTYNTVAFSAVVEHEFQQLTSKLYPHVKVEMLKSADQTIDGLDAVEMKATNGLYQPIVFDQINHTRRGVGRKEYAIDLPIDEKEISVILANQSVEYAKAIVAAAARQIDRIVSAAFFAPIQTWHTESNGVSVPDATLLTFEQDGGETIDAKAGLTYAKMVESKRKFVNKNVSLEDNKFIFCGTGDEMEALMNEDKFIDNRYTNQMVVDNGNLVRVAGIDCKFFAAGDKLPVIGLDSDGYRECAIFVEGGITLAVNKGVTIQVKDRPDLRGTKQVSAVLSMGAVRNKAGVVQKVLTTVKA